MKIFCIYQDKELPSSRIRITQMVPHLEARGLTCEVAPYPRRLARLARVLRRARRFDLVWLQKKLPRFSHRLLLRGAGVPVVFDFDDAICFRQRPVRGLYRSASRRRRFDGVTGLATALTCGNAYLASLVKADRRAHLYPSPVPLEVPRRDYLADNGPVRLGWIGGRGNAANLARIVPALRRLRSKHRFVLRVVSDAPMAAEGVEVEYVPWSLAEQERRLAELDVGLMPLDRGSSYDRGKCSYKVLQYMAAGVAAVAEDVGMNAEVIRDGVNGRLVFEGNWEATLNELLSAGRDTMSTLGACGRETVEKEFSYPLQAARLEKFFRGVTPGKGG